MSQPKISVVIPVYNGEKYIRRCLDSVLNQTFKDIEVILVDDGSKDESGRICDEIQSKDSRVIVIHQSNSGTGFARNAGTKIARGEFLSFVDSDDYIDLSMYEKLLDCVRANDADTCIFGYYRVRDGVIYSSLKNAIEGTFIGQEALDNIFLNALGTEPSSYSDFKILWQSPCVSLYSLDLIRKNNIAFPQAGKFVSFSEDVLFNIDYFFHAEKVTVMSEQFYYYCETKNSSTTSFKEDRFLTNVDLYREILNRVRDKLKDEGLFKRAEERIQRTFLAAARNCIMSISAFFSYKEGRGRIRDICSNSVLREVLDIYPWAKNPLKYRLFNYGLKNRRLWFLYRLGKFKK